MSDVDPAELEGLRQQLAERTAQLNAAQAELQTTNLGLIELTGELEDRVAARTAELRALEQQYRALFEQAAEGIYEATLEGQYRLVNPALAGLLGYDSPEEMLELVSDAGRQVYVEPGRHAEFMELLIGEGLVTQFESEARRRDGSLVWISENARLMHDSTGAMLGYTGTVEDTTERRRAEAAQAALRAQEEAARAKDEIASIVSHELRTPLNGVIGMIELLLDTPLNERQREFAQTVRESGKALRGIINDILDFSKIDAGRLELECMEFDLRELLEEVVLLFAEPARRTGLEIGAAVEAAVPPRLTGDPLRLRQTVTNLISNAIKFTQQGGIAVRARISGHHEGATLVRVEVSDTGIGLVADAQRWLFTPFSQADTSTSRRYGGAGLGLAICKRLAELMGGSIGVDSTLGRGSTFWFTAQLGIGTNAPRARPAIQPGLRVLVVDDNATARRLLLEQLAAIPVVAASAESGGEALTVLRGSVAAGAPYQAALIDMRMPGMDGLELARRIGADPQLAGMKLVLVQAMDAGREQTFREAGISCALTKPVREQQLRDALAGTTEQRETGSGQTAAPSDTAGPAADWLRGTHILVADDSAVNQQVASAVLQRWGCVVDTADNGREAVEAAQRRHYGAILMDCDMPLMSGYDATAEIRRVEAGSPRTLIIAVTGMARDSDRERCQAVGMDDYIAKPMRAAELLAALERHMQGQAAGVPQSGQPEAGAEAATSAAIDSGILKGFDRDALAEVLPTVFETTPGRLVSLRAALQGDDAEELARAAHVLCGEASLLGAAECAQVCREIEKTARTGQVEPARALLGRLEAAFERMMASLEELRRQVEAP